MPTHILSIPVLSSESYILILNVNDDWAEFPDTDPIVPILLILPIDEYIPGLPYAKVIVLTVSSMATASPVTVNVITCSLSLVLAIPVSSTDMSVSTFGIDMTTLLRFPAESVNSNDEFPNFFIVTDNFMNLFPTSCISVGILLSLSKTISLTSDTYISNGVLYD